MCAQIICGTLAICHGLRLSEEVLAEAVELHFKAHHTAPSGVSEEMLQKWVSKMACAIKNLCGRFRRLFSVSEGAKSKKIAELKQILRTRLVALYGDSWKEKAHVPEEEAGKEAPDAMELLPSLQWAELDKLVASQDPGQQQLVLSAARVGPVAGQPKAKAFQAKLDKLVLPTQASALHSFAVGSVLYIYKKFSF